MNETTLPQTKITVETIYATFGNKRSVLSRLVDVSVVGGDELVPLPTRLAIRITEQEPEQRRQIRMFAGRTRELMTRMAIVFDIMRTAAR